MKVIVELGIDDLNPDPSYGSHFFQNLTSMHIGYFTLTKNGETADSEKHIAIVIRPVNDPPEAIPLDSLSTDVYF